MRQKKKPKRRKGKKKNNIDAKSAVIGFGSGDGTAIFNDKDRLLLRSDEYHPRSLRKFLHNLRCQTR